MKPAPPPGPLTKGLGRGLVGLASIAVLIPASQAADTSTALLDSPATRQAIRQMARQPAPAARIDASAAGRNGALAASISRAGVVGLVDAGIATAASAVTDCLKGESAGSGLGLAGLPDLRPSALSDHCHR